MEKQPIIFHIDVNSAFLSWEANYRMHTMGETVDIRTIPAVIGGSEAERHGIVLAKSTPAKRYRIQTGEPLAHARKKCPNLVIVPPTYSVYVDSSRRFVDYLKQFTPDVEPYSIDEVFCDFTGTEHLYGKPETWARQLADQIRDTLGFTVNIGISSNRLLAKMASDFEKPDKVHTLFPEEIPAKMWPLDIRELFFVGKASEQKLRTLGIHTIGDLARTDRDFLHHHLKKHGETIWDFAHGIDHGEITKNAPPQNKGYGNSITLSYDVTDPDAARVILLSLCETVGARIRADKAYVGVVGVTITDHNFHHMSHQKALSTATDVTYRIYETACELFDELWTGTPIRLLGVFTSRATEDQSFQYTLFDSDKYQRLSQLDKAIDTIRGKYGEDSVQRACFIKSRQTHMSGGIGKAKRTEHTQRGSADKE